MNENTFRIMTTLTNNLDRPFSINSLSSQIKSKYHTGDYKSIYYTIKDLEKENFIYIEKFGNSSIISPNFNNYSLFDLLSRFELKKKEEFIKKYPEYEPLIYELVSRLHNDFFLIDSISIINPEKNQALNRAEFIIIIEKISLENIKSCSNLKDLEQELFEAEKIKLYRAMGELEQKYNIKLDFLILNKEDFQNFVQGNDNNIIQKMILNQIVLLYPQNYWANVQDIFRKNIRIKIGPIIKPGTISKKDLVYNLNRFGYKELGSKLSNGRNLRLEYIILSVMLSKDARKKEAIPILIKKNIASGNDLNIELLLFYSKKYSKLEEMFGYFKILYKIYKDEAIEYPIRLLEGLDISPKKLNERAIKEKLRLYYGKDKSKQ